jgi:hypothetical protein
LLTSVPAKVVPDKQIETSTDNSVAPGQPNPHLGNNKISVARKPCKEPGARQLSRIETLTHQFHDLRYRSSSRINRRWSSESKLKANVASHRVELDSSVPEVPRFQYCLKYNSGESRKSGEIYARTILCDQ